MKVSAGNEKTIEDLIDCHQRTNETLGEMIGIINGMCLRKRVNDYPHDKTNMKNNSAERTLRTACPILKITCKIV